MERINLGINQTFTSENEIISAYSSFNLLRFYQNPSEIRVFEERYIEQNKILQKSKLGFSGSFNKVFPLKFMLNAQRVGKADFGDKKYRSMLFQTFIFYINSP